MKATLLVELLTEELPPKVLEKLGKSFADNIFDMLVKQQFVRAETQYNAFASPRRLAVQIPDVLAVQPECEVIRKGPSLVAGMKDGVPTKALEGFARSCGAEIEMLEVIYDGKQEIYANRFLKTGEPLSGLLPDIVSQTLKKLPVPKLMHWGDRDDQFVRPVHGLIMLHGSTVVTGEVLRCQSRQVTLGHRFLSDGEITIGNADSYDSIMTIQGKVIASFVNRRQIIRSRLREMASRLNAVIAADESLYDEVCALVEWPVVLEGKFDASFLSVPQECLILTMQQNQKYFPLLDQQGKLINRFLLVSNLESPDSSVIIHGNERVLKARLSDAQFFFIQDKKQRLDSRVPKLANVVYHNKLGSQLERVQRLEQLAGDIAFLLNEDVVLAERAARLAKADLLSSMVGEFPELQGIMGRYYALHDGERIEVANAIAQHYQPRFAGDALPDSNLGTILSLADKLEMLVGIWGVGLIPTGEKDPFALRRATLGILRMLQHQPLDLKVLLRISADTFPVGSLSADVVEAVYGFCMDRMKHYLSEDYSNDVIDAVLALFPVRMDGLNTQLQAVTTFKQLPEAKALAAANKRVKNILRKQDEIFGQVEPSLLIDHAEKQLFHVMQTLQPQVEAALQEQSYSLALESLAGLKESVDQYFTDVMVMADDGALRCNRLMLLKQLSGLLNCMADIALLDI